ncbi:MAG: hypothetical protein Q8O19_07645 [Rectinemataceae bacterium]|nr:hypothetical protein [Rectinemataceae bacterium]
MKSRFPITVPLVLALCLTATIPAFAQQSGSQQPPGSAGLTHPDSFSRGDQTLSLTTGFQIPLFIVPDPTPLPGSELLLGGSFAFTYQYFLTSHLAIGGTLNGAFNGTVGGRSLFIAPLSFRTAYWWTRGSLEAGLGLEAGAYLMRLNSYGMIGPFAKFGPALAWRITDGWSIGTQLYYWFVPEIHTGDYASETRFGNFLEFSFAAVYHL